MLTGAFWFIHVAYYPTFKYISAEFWSKFFSKRYQNTSMVVYPIMAFETMANMALYFMMLHHRAYLAFSIATFLLILIWIWHFVVLNRKMNQLSEGYSEEIFKDLQKSSFIRGMGYTLRLICLMVSLVG